MKTQKSWNTISKPQQLKLKNHGIPNSKTMGSNLKTTAMKTQKP